MRENYSSIAASEKILACLGEDGQLKGLFWPYKDSRHSHLEFSICGFAIDGESIWLDPIRDNIHISYCTIEKIIHVKWELKHPKFFGAVVTKKSSAHYSSFIEKWNLFVPKEYASSKINLWLLSNWNLHSEKRFQSVYSETGEDMIFAFSENFWVGIGAYNRACYSHFQSVRAIQSTSSLSLGEIINYFLAEPNRFRHIEMGNVYAAACTQPFALTKCKDKDDFYEGEISIFYGFGSNQEELKHKFSLYFDNTALAKEINETINNRSIQKIQDLTLPQQRNFLKNISLDVLNALTDEKGGMIAAPECDLDFKNSGGYGFVWPRDTAFCALGLMRCGLYQKAKPILLFLAKVQSHNGDYFQRFDCQGNKAPSWCELQADQLGLVIISMIEYLKYEKNDLIFESIKKGIQKLTNDFSEKGSLQNSFDLWEEIYGLHFYSHVCAYGALNRALPLFPDLEIQIRNSMKACHHFCHQHLYLLKQHRFARTLDPHHNRDLQADISLLSCIFPISEFPIEDSTKLSIFEFCYDKLTTKAGTLRYEKDHYMGGNSWVLAGFWMAQAARELSKTQPQLTEISFEIFKKTMNLCNETGFFPEQVDSNSGKPIWVMPLAWSHSFYLWANEDFI